MAADRPSVRRNADVKKKRVRFCTVEDMGMPKEHRNVSADGLLLHVRGHGQLCIRSASSDANDNSVEIDIQVNINSEKVPVTLFLPHEQSNSKLEITGDGDIQFAVKDSTDVKKATDVNVFHAAKSELNDLSKETLVVENGQNNEFRKAHRRNNSDFLQITGKDENLTEYKELNNTSALSKTADSKIDTQCNLSKIETDDCSKCRFFCNNNHGNIQIDEKERKIKDTYGEDTERPAISADKISLSSERNKTDTKAKLLNQGLSRSFSFSNSLPEMDKSSFSLCEAIRQSYTYLLDVLDLLDLCDHLYEKYVISLAFYKKLFDMCLEPNHVRNAKRSLLIYLSTRAVKRESLIDALFGSAQYQLIPCFYPEVRL